MPHIHTIPNQHDMTVSAYIVRREGEQWKCMVHFHRKIDTYMQIGGHIELDETPWQAMVHELEEESGYSPDELQLAQHSDKHVMGVPGNVTHPTPFTMNTHNVGNDHYHSDIRYGFVANDPPKNPTSVGESTDIRWFTLAELRASVKSGESIADVEAVYNHMLDHLGTYALVPASLFSQEKPSKNSTVYLRGAPGE